MELEKRVDEHDKMLKAHTDEISDIKSEIKTMNKSISESLTRVDESNRFLREQNTRQSEQNTQILSAVLQRNSQSEERQHELSKIKLNSAFKIGFAIFGSGGLVYVVIDIITKAISK